MVTSDKANATSEVSNSCYLRWTNITKIVEVKDKSAGLVKSSIYTSGNGNPASNEVSDATAHKLILSQVSGEANPGEMLALMGPSGSGKTSLLDILSTRDSSFNDGSLRWNQNDIYKSVSHRKKFKRQIAYIKQKDLFFEHLTVKDQLTYTAFLRLSDTDNTKEEILQEVDKVISLLRLGKCSNTPIRLVSGGEKKRVNIGSELLTDPSIIMLDEPTSGLDSTSAVALMSLLYSLAHDHGKTIITSIHQPSSAVFHQFDKVLFLAEGCVVYHGTPSGSLSYSQSKGFPCPGGYNSADHWMDLLVEDSAIDQGDSKQDRSEEEGKDSTPFETDDLVSPTEVDKTIDALPNVNITIPDGDGDTNSNSKSSPINVSTTPYTKSNKSFFKKRSLFRRKTPVYVPDLIKRKRNELSKGTTPKAKLITSWDNEAYTQQLQGSNGSDIVDDNESEYSSSSSKDSDMKAGSSDGSKSKKFNTSWITQFRVLLHRSLKNSRSAILTPLNLMKSISLGLMCGLLWFQMPNTERTVVDRSSFLFFTCVYWIFDSIFAALFTFPSERAIIFKERDSGSYHLSAYFLAKTLSELPTRLCLPTIYLVLSYWMANIHPNFGIFLASTCCTLLGVLAGESIGLFVGAVIMDFQKAMTVTLVFTLSLMVAGGFYVENVPEFMLFTQYLSPFKYAYDANRNVIFNRNVPCDGSGVMEVICAKEDVTFATADQVKEFLDVKGGLFFNIGIMFVLIAVPRYAALWALKLKRGDVR